MKKILLCFLLPLFGVLFSGCRTHSQPAAPVKAAVPQKVSLEQAVRTAVSKSADMRTLDSLQLIAREHVEKSRLLELPDMIYDLPRRLGSLTIENDLRLHTLDHALESCRILTRPAQSDLNAIQRKEEENKIRLEISSKWAKLAYFHKLRQGGYKSADISMRQKEIILELSISSGIPEKMISDFDLSSLPMPREIILPPLPEYVRKIKAAYGSSPDAALRFADIVYRLPGELLRRRDSDFNAAFELTLAVGTALKTDIVKAALDRAYSNFRTIEKAIKKSGADTPGLYAELEQAILDWRLAFFRLEYDRSPFPAQADKKECVFLLDLISLQGK